MLERYKVFSIKEEIDNIDLCNIDKIQLIDAVDFIELYNLGMPGIPVRNNKYPEKVFTLCNAHTMESVYNLRDVLSKVWRRKILFLGTRLSNNITTYFPLLNFADGFRQDDEARNVLRTYDEVRNIYHAQIWLNRSYCIAVY